MGTAAVVAGFGRRWPGSFVAPTLSGPAPGGGEFLPDVFGSARQYIEMAFGADLTADPATWSWTDVTRYVLWEDGVNTSLGRPEESLAFVPAWMTCTLRNDQPGGGDFTLGNPLGRFWPNVRENTPTRARIDVGNGPSVRFFGYATVYKPSWDADRQYSVVQFRATGIGRKLKQGKSASQSPMWRFIMLSHRYPVTTNTAYPDADFYGSGPAYHALPARYWPMEDGPNALQLTDAIDARYSFKATSFGELPRFASGTIASGSKPVPVFEDDALLRAVFPVVPLGASQYPSVTTSGLRVQFLMRLPQESYEEIDAAGTNVEIIRIHTTGTIARYSLWFEPSGGLSLSMHAYDASGTDLGSTPLFFDVAVIDADVLVSVELNQNGADTESNLVYTQLTTTPTTGGYLGSLVNYALNIAGRTIVGVNRIEIAPSGGLAGLMLGHMAIFNGGAGTFPLDDPPASRGRSGDTVEQRLRRTCVEDGVPIDIIGTPDTGILMGVQGIGGFFDIVAECEAVDQGYLLDGLSAGMTYIARSHAYSATPTLTLDAERGHIQRPLPAEADDQGRVNTFTAFNPSGGQQTFSQEDGDLGTGTVGTYDDSGNFPLAVDSYLGDEAAWRVNLGTVGGLRYPKLTFELAKPNTSVIAQQWLDCQPFSRIDATSIEPGAVIPDGMFLLRGWQERWNSKLWTATANVSRYSPWSVAVLAELTGDRSDHIARLDTDGSILAADVPMGADWTDDFENGVADWVATGGTFVATGARFYSGAAAGLLTTTGAPALTYARKRTTVTAGVSYAAICWVYSEAGYGTVGCAIDWYDSGGGYLSTTSTAGTALAAGVWASRAVAGTAPAGAAYGDFGPTLGGSPPAGTALFVDYAGGGPVMSVATEAGYPIWTTTADDIDGLVIVVDGLPVSVRNITGSSSPQAFTVDGGAIRKALSSGASVSVWQPPVLGL